jgi:hypothetical protein
LPGAVWSGVSVARDWLIRKERLIVFEQLGDSPEGLFAADESSKHPSIYRSF